MNCRSKATKCIVYLLTVLICIVLAGCGADISQNSKTGEKTLKFACSDYTTINPILNTHDEIPDIIFSGLMKYNEKGKPICDLAKSYKFDADALTYTFKLRDGVKWQDGKPFTANDVKFTLDLLANDKNLSAAITDNYKDIKDVKVVDKNTLKVKLSQPNAAMLNYLTIGILPEHLLKGQDIMTTSFNQHPIGTGRYKFVSWDKGQSITVEKNDSYYGKKPKIDKIIFKIIPDENAKAMQVKSGGVDIAWLNAQNAKSFKGNDKFTIYKFTTSDYRAIAPNFKNAFWQKHPELISIIGYAIDKKAIVKSVLNDDGQVAYSPLQMNQEYNDADVEQRQYNPEKFKQLVEKLGWKLGPDGIYQKNGEKLSFSVDAREYEEQRVDIANVVSKQLQKVGVDMKVHIVSKLDWKQLQCFLIGEAAPFDPDNGTYDLFHTGGSGNYTYYSNASVDRCLEAAREATDEDKRKKEYRDFQQEWAKNPAYIMIAYLNGNYVANKKVTGLSTKRILGHHAVGVMWNIEDWDIAQ